MNRFLKQLFIESVLAGGLLIIAKIIGLIGALWITQARYTFSTDSSGLLPILKLSVLDLDSLTTITSYSNALFTAIMILLVITVTSRILLTRIAANNSKIVAKVIYYNLFEWMEHGHTIYPKMLIWLVFTWLGALLVLRDALIGISWYSIPIVFITFAIVCSFLVFLDIDRHLQIISFPQQRESRKTKHSSI